MPPLVPVIFIGAAIYGAYRLISRELAIRAERTMRAAEELRRRAAPVPRDLGALVYDANAGVYRPRAARAP
jgi:hypothetical protein